MERKEWKKLSELYAKEGRAAVASMYNGLHINATTSTTVTFAYVLLRASDPKADMTSAEAFCKSLQLDNDRTTFIAEYTENYWNILASMRNQYPVDVLKSVILFYEEKNGWDSYCSKTPVALINLANSLFDYQSGDTVADFGAGMGVFLSETFMSHPELNYYGVELDASANEVLSIRLEVMGCQAVLEQNNIFDIDADTHRYNKIFSNYPFGIKIFDYNAANNRLLHRVRQDSGLVTNSSDWLFNAAILECLDDDGKAIVIMTNGSTWNTTERKAREYFVENGYLEAVIALPDKMFDYTNIATTMMVLSKKHHENVMLVDATHLCEKGRRFNTISDEQISKIVAAVHNEGEHSHSVSLSELRANEYVINPTRYLTEKVEVENGIPFENMIKSITRGAPMRASDLDDLVSDVPTDYQYLMLSNIQNGQIDSELPYLKTIDANLEKYCLKNHALILSKNGAPFKIAVAEVEEGKKIMANGNLYMIELDESKIDPYFAKAFLESEKGIAILKSIAVGTAIPNISVESVRKIKMPNWPLEKQHEMVAKYKAAVDSIALYKLKIEKLTGELAHIYDNMEW